MWGINDLETLLRNAKNPELLDHSLYLEADPDLGFTIEII